MAEARLAGYLEPLADSLPASDPVPVWESPESRRELGREGARRLLGRDPRPTALLCRSDELALGAMEAARDLGLSVPGDLSVVGFDDIPAASLANPPLTTVRQPLDEKGRRVGDLALALLSGRRPPRQRPLGVGLEVRSSTAPAPGASGSEAQGAAAPS